MKITKTTYNSLFVDAVAGVFPTNTTQEIGSDDMRKLSEDTKDSTFFLEDDAYTGAKGTRAAINTITGLKAIATLALPTGVLISFRDTGNGNVLRVYELVTGTDAEASPNTIRPNDYAASTNEKVWKIAVTAGGWGSITGTVTDQADLVSYINRYQYISAT